MVFAKLLVLLVKITMNMEREKIHAFSASRTSLIVRFRPPSNMELRCALCEASIPVNAYKNHQRIHTEDGVFSCPECGKQFSNSKRLRIHQRIHTVGGAFICPECGKSSSIFKDLKVHQRIHAGERPLSCSWCDNKFSDPSFLRCHQRKHTGNSPFICSDCNKSCGTSTEPSQPYIWEKPFHCSKCDKCFSLSLYMKRHQKTHTNMTHCKLAHQSESQNCTTFTSHIWSLL